MQNLRPYPRPAESDLYFHTTPPRWLYCAHSDGRSSALGLRKSATSPNGLTQLSLHVNSQPQVLPQNVSVLKNILLYVQIQRFFLHWLTGDRLDIVLTIHNIVHMLVCLENKDYVFSPAFAKIQFLFVALWLPDFMLFSSSSVILVPTEKGQFSLAGCFLVLLSLCLEVSSLAFFGT